MHLCGELHLPEILFGWTPYYFFEALFLFLCLCKYFDTAIFFGSLPIEVYYSLFFCATRLYSWLFIHRKVLQWSCFCAPFALCELVICISLNNVPIAHPWIFMPIFSVCSSSFQCYIVSIGSYLLLIWSKKCFCFLILISPRMMIIQFSQEGNL